MVFSLSLYLSQYFWTCKRNMVKSPSLTTLLPNYTMYFIIFVDAESIELLWHYPGRFNPRLQYYYKKMVSLFLIPVPGVKSICCWLICASINQSHINFIIIWFIFSILFIGSEPTTWPANNCLQIMVFSCAYGSNDDLAINNILLMQSCVHEKQTYSKNKLIDQMIKQLLLNSVFTTYLDFSVSRRSILCLSHRLRQIIDLLTTGSYFEKILPNTAWIHNFKKTSSVPCFNIVFVLINLQSFVYKNFINGFNTLGVKGFL